MNHVNIGIDNKTIPIQNEIVFSNSFFIILHSPSLRVGRNFFHPATPDRREYNKKAWSPYWLVTLVLRPSQSLFQTITSNLKSTPNMQIACYLAEIVHIRGHSLLLCAVWKYESCEVSRRPPQSVNKRHFICPQTFSYNTIFP